MLCSYPLIQLCRGIRYIVHLCCQISQDVKHELVYELLPEHFAIDTLVKTFLDLVDDNTSKALGTISANDPAWMIMSSLPPTPLDL